MAFTYTGEMVDLGFGRGWLSRSAAASVRRIDRQIGHPLQITEAGRTWGRQNEHWLTYKRVGWPIALHPDTPSEHQKGLSIDSDEAQRIIAILEDHGWRRTVYRWVNGVWTLVERWHFEYFAHLDNHRNDPAPSGSNTAAPVSEEDDMTLMVKAAKNIYVFSHGQIKLSDDVEEIRDGLAAGIRQIDLAGSVPQVNAQLVRRMNFFGVPQSVVCTDGVPRALLDGNGWVLNPETNRYEKNGMWSWERLNRATLAKLTKAS